MAISEREKVISEKRNPRVVEFHTEDPSLSHYTRDLHPVLQYKPQVRSRLFSAEWVIDEVEVVGGNVASIYRRRVVQMKGRESRENSYLGRLARLVRKR